MKPFEKGQCAVEPPGHDDAASAVFLRPCLERSQEMRAISPVRRGSRTMQS